MLHQATLKDLRSQSAAARCPAAADLQDPLHETSDPIQQEHNGRSNRRRLREEEQLERLTAHSSARQECDGNGHTPEQHEIEQPRAAFGRS